MRVRASIFCAGRLSLTVHAPLSGNISRGNYDSLCGIFKQTPGSCKKCSAYSVRHKTYSRAGDAFKSGLTLETGLVQSTEIVKLFKPLTPVITFSNSAICP
jgi:hypothetical protein